MLKNINKDEIEIALAIFSDNNISGGGTIENHEFNEYTKVLIINYQEAETALSVLNHGPVQRRNKNYQAKPVCVTKTTQKGK